MPAKKIVFKIKFNSAEQIKSVVKCVLIFFIFMIVFPFEKDFFPYILMIYTFFIIVEYLISVKKVILGEEEVILQKFPEPLYLSYFNIENIFPADKSSFKLLIKKTPSFYIFGKGGWYKSKRFENLFIYSCSNSPDDNVIIEYGSDYYMISVENRDEFIKLVKEKGQLK